MTLSQWEIKHKKTAYDHEKGGTFIVNHDLSEQALEELYHLSDWAVTTISSNTIWIVLRK